MSNRKLVSSLSSSSSSSSIRTIVSGTKHINKSSSSLPKAASSNSNIGSSDTEKENLKYLRNWLGNVGGDRYLNQVANGNITGYTNVKLTPSSLPSSPSSSSPSNYNTYMIPLLKIKNLEKNLNINDIRILIDNSINELKNDTNSYILDGSNIIDNDYNDDVIKDILHYIKNSSSNNSSSINVIGITNVSNRLQSIDTCGLNIISLSQNLMTNKPIVNEDSKPKTTVRSIPNKPSMIHYGAVRSGQQIYAEGSSLVIVGSVNSGGEVLADGDIHVYGNLKGRAIAGLGGSHDASIFAQKFEPSMVGIVDAFAIIDDFPQLNEVIGKGVCVKFLKKGLQQDGSIIVNCGDSDDKKLTVSLLPTSL
jgi:septum site-determining protein MinC